MPLSFIEILVAGSFLAAAASFLGVFVVLRRMALVPDVLSHVALPGIALGFLLHFDPFLGALAFLLAAVFLVEKVESWTHLGTETVIGALFTAAMAAGSLWMPEEELLEALFGDISNISRSDFWLGIFGSALVMAILLARFRHLARFFMATELTRSEEPRIKNAHLFYLMALALIVALGIKIMGVLLMGSLIILPAIAARSLAGNLRALFLSSILIAVFAVGVGMSVSGRLAIPPGPAIILVNTALFVVSLGVAKLLSALRQPITR